MEMPWHTDIPNHATKPFPFRSLWMVKNPNPQQSGRTRWLNIEDGMNYLSGELLEMLPHIKVLQQSWYKPGTDEAVFNFIKTHPITGKHSLRVNHHNNLERGVSDAWIKHVYVDGVEQPDCSLIRRYIDELLKHPELFYEHTWDDYDIALYDNWSFLHSRSELQLGETPDTNERKFYRVNIDHVQKI
jgi:alpha-ketoglutarate-dependent taurine dioxygenase